MLNLFKRKNEKSLVEKFEFYRNYFLSEIEKLKDDNELTDFEEKALISFIGAAYIAAKTYLTTKELPHIKIKSVESEATIIDAYFFLCAIELHGFLARIKNVKEIERASDTTTEKLINKIAKVFGGEDLGTYMLEFLESFDTVEKLANGDPRDLWFNQALSFGNRLSEERMNFVELVDQDLAAKMTVSFISIDLQIISAKLFDEIVLGKKANN